MAHHSPRSSLPPRLASPWIDWLRQLFVSGPPEWTPTDSRWLTLPMPDGRPLSLWAADLYQDPVMGLIRRAKYGRDWASAQAVARGCAQVTGSAVWARQPILIPIPSDPARLGPRGFHLPLLIALAIGRSRHCRVCRTGLLKQTHTPVQAGLSRTDRLAALRDHFVAAPSLRGKVVLLVDDVVTTGATLAVARERLEAIGAEVLGGLVAARVPSRATATPTLHTCPRSTPRPAQGRIKAQPKRFNSMSS